MCKKWVCGMLGSEPTGPSVGLVLFYGRSSPAWLSRPAPPPPHPGKGREFPPLLQPILLPPELTKTCCLEGQETAVSSGFPSPVSSPVLEAGEKLGGKQGAVGTHVALAP